MSGLFDLTGRSAMVTGAAGGIGAPVAQALATAGASVLVTDIDKDAAAGTAERISAAGGKADAPRWTSRTATAPSRPPRRPPASPMESCTSWSTTPA